MNTDWIIPARAGFTDRALRPRPHDGDHPRSRGVYQVERLAASVAGGSSPLARGLRRGRVATLLADGIIPARAGFTGHGRAADLRPWDHPRSRGVYAVCSREGGYLLGIIPARAGFTGRDGTGPVTAADHPRSRGVYRPVTWFVDH